MQAPKTTSLDPQSAAEWDALRQQGHRMLDDIFDYMQNLREGPVWQSAPADVRQQFLQALPREGKSLQQTHESFKQHILPYAIGNAHPGFMGWVQGGGNPVGMLAEMLAAGVNANVGGRDQMPVEVERQITRWMAELFEFPDTATGIFVTGASLANLIGLWVAKTKALGQDTRKLGLHEDQRQLVAYTSAGAHACIKQAMDLAGIGTQHLRVIPMSAQFELDCQALRKQIQADRAAGFTPFFLAGTAGTVDVGAIDDLSQLADIAEEEELWFHVDGAFGAMAILAPNIAPRLRGIQRADSIAFDFHKWLQVPYDAGFILVRDGQLHYDSFAAAAGYLRRENRGMAAGSPWPCDFGPDLSRGFRALKTWFTIQVYGAQRLGEVVQQTCDLAQYLKTKIEAQPQLELLAPVSLNIVCFRYRGPQSDVLNSKLAVALQESGIVAPSTNILPQGLAIRAAIVNHRTNAADIDALVSTTLRLGAQIVEELAASK
jgi:aromatic-L-amino-acid decarboxylase